MISGGEQVAENVSQMIFNFHERIQRNSSDDKNFKNNLRVWEPILLQKCVDKMID